MYQARYELVVNSLFQNYFNALQCEHKMSTVWKFEARLETDNLCKEFFGL